MEVMTAIEAKSGKEEKRKKRKGGKEEKEEMETSISVLGRGVSHQAPGPPPYARPLFAAYPSPMSLSS